MKNLVKFFIVFISVLVTACSQGGFSVDPMIDPGVAGTRTPGSEADPDPSNPDNGSEGTTLTSVLVSWAIPTTRTDGTALLVSEVREYRIYFRSADGFNSEQTLVVDGGNSISAVISNLAAKEWIFAITTVDTDLQESARSPEISVNTTTGKMNHAHFEFAAYP